jgi:hypothetical protein
MTASVAFALLSQGVLASSALLAVAARIPGLRLVRGTLPAVAAWGTLVLLPVAIRVDGLPLAFLLRGLLGDPSVVSVVLLALAAVRPGALPAGPPPRAALLIALSAGFLLYLSLAAGPLPDGLDLYALGWLGTPILAALAVLAVLAFLRGANRWVVVVSFALLAWGAGLVESDNLLDALVDPGLVLACALRARRPAHPAQL